MFNYDVKTDPEEFYRYECPNCGAVRNAGEVAEELDISVLRLAVARGNALSRRRKSAGTGRPIVGRCPGCSQEMSSVELRHHRVPCVRNHLLKLRGKPILLTPKDPDPYPNFYIRDLNENEAEFFKGSNHDVVTVDLRKIGEIGETDGIGYIRLLGRIVWHDDIKRWRFIPTRPLGRPPQRLIQ